MQHPSNPPKISVIIPAYNVEKTIRDTIESVRNQSFSDFEIVVINDGSTDNTLEVVDRIQDDRIKVFSYENRGSSVARNRGIDRALGELITFIDADDLWTSDKLELQFKALQDYPEAGAVYSWTFVMDESGKQVHQGVSTSFQGNVYPQLLVGNFVASGSNMMLRRHVIEDVGEFDPALKSSEDWDYWLRVAPKFPIAVVPKFQILYRQSRATLSSNVAQMEACMLSVHERAFRAAPKSLRGLKNQSLSFIYRYAAKLYLERCPGVEGVHAASHKLRQAIQLYPRSLFNKGTQKLLLKIVLNRLLTPKVAGLLLRRVSAMRSVQMQPSS